MRRKVFLYTSVVSLLIVLPGAGTMDAEIKTGQHPYFFGKELTVEISCDYLLHLPKGYGKESR